ncbi:bifunctional lysylphosphatidylglycerol flippase/synthetase MprF [Bacillus sp. LBG-1-113]|uniref:bifunctional lysylphosphatidylglycerol flippase/synthetase MprF n=1 Tax=Bacillus sp. LBG-1-113 TaxID=2886094 RepID=UPI001E487CB2|nr:bifunctional lysylphosphatidylglycerol flippase/synthetase MprF [Bacillus sp. LBG-1-113]MCC2930446.1 bifunctional lysylphosphatidylglycerol flippase/synthetase MprF [Bacillus sp. LBG-1-113]
MLIKKNALSILKIVFPVAVLLFVFYQSKKELTNLSFKRTLMVINGLERTDLFILVLIGLLAVAAMSLYDYVLKYSLRLSITNGKVFRVSWIANSFNNVLGFGGLAGVGLRMMFYKEHTKDHKALVKGIAWLTSSMLLGLSVFSIFVIARLLPVDEVINEKPWLWAVVIGFALIVPISLAAAIRKGRKAEGEEDGDIVKNPIFAYMGASVAEWLMAGIVIYLSLLAMGIHADIRYVFGVFVIAAIGGMISLVPGGFGSFDLLFLLGMEQLGYHQEAIVTSIVLYRLVYSFIPFVLGLFFAAGDLTESTMKRLETNPRIAPAIETTNVLLVVQRAMLVRILQGSLSLIVFVGGLIVLASVSLPIDRLTVIPHIPHPVLLLFNGLSLSSALILLILPIELYKRTKRSYTMAITALVGGFVFSFLKGLNISAIFILPIIIVLLVLLKKQFVREQASYTLGQMIFAAALFTVALFNYNLIASFIWDRMKKVLRHEYFVHSTSHITHATIMAVIAVPLFFFIFTVVYHKKTKPIGEKADPERLAEFLNDKGGNALSHLGFLGDKRFYFSSDGNALLLFGKIARRLVVLGDPSGQKESFPLVLEEFLNEAHQKGFSVLFYQIEREDMALYHDFGYNFFKLGEEAYVDLNTFTISGKKKAGLRAINNRFEREEYTFHVDHPPFSEAFLEELKQISDEWLGSKKEKGFSLGFFDPSYLQRAPIAYMKNAEGDIVAFANIMPMYQEGEISVDLMRYRSDAPNGIMDALFIRMFLWAKEEGCTSFNMGMAPLANVGTAFTSFWSERFAAVIFNNVRYMYSFSGLRAFKEKYKPEWRGKYLAYRKNRSLSVTMFLVTRLIGKSKKNSV